MSDYDEERWAEADKAADEVIENLRNDDIVFSPMTEEDLEAGVAEMDELVLRANESDTEEEVRARITASVDEAIKLIGKPGVFSDEELEADMAEAIEASRWASELDPDDAE